MTDRPATLPATRAAPRIVTVLVAAIVLAGLPAAIASGVGLVVFLPYALVGALLIIRRPRNVIGWLLIGIGWAFLAGFEHIPTTTASLRDGTASPIISLLAWQQGWSWFGAFALFVVVTIIFPSGHLPTGRWRMAALGIIIAAWLGVGLASLAQMIFVGNPDGPGSITIANPAASVIPQPLYSWFASATPVGVVVVVATLFAGSGSMVIRTRRARGLEHQQLRWLMTALSAVALTTAFSFVVQGIFGDNVPDLLLAPLILAFIAVPISIGVAVLRYRLYEIDTIINRTILYGGVTLALLAAFGIANIGLQRLLETTTGARSELLTGAIGIGVGTLYGPIRRWIRPGVDRFLPGRAMLTLLFTDIVGSTERIVELGDEQWRVLLGRYRAAVRQELSRYSGHEVDTAGDAFFATFERPSLGVGCAVAIRSAAEKLGIQLRTAVHLGECEMRGEKVSGIEVHTAARIMAAASAGEILLSASARDAIPQAEFPTGDRGTHELKGVPGAWQLYALQGNSGAVV
ncbi:MAG: adenylate/guanylate cyclase domain-containing protein [Chloroflexota bacterium]|nr:adenylate/guanylate cyclase domain-containing protein [Chloroflexota bacterium]